MLQMFHKEMDRSTGSEKNGIHGYYTFLSNDFFYDTYEAEVFSLEMVCYIKWKHMEFIVKQVTTSRNYESVASHCSQIHIHTFCYSHLS